MQGGGRGAGAPGAAGGGTREPQGSLGHRGRHRGELWCQLGQPPVRWHWQGGQAPLGLEGPPGPGTGTGAGAGDQHSWWCGGGGVLQGEGRGPFRSQLQQRQGACHTPSARPLPPASRPPAQQGEGRRPHPHP